MLEHLCRPKCYLRLLFVVSHVATTCMVKYRFSYESPTPKNAYFSTPILTVSTQNYVKLIFQFWLPLSSHAAYTSQRQRNL